MKIHIFIFFLVIILITNASAQQIALFEVNIGTNQSNLAVPMQINLDPLTFLPEDELVLYLLDGKTKQSIPFQVKSAETRTLHWLLMPNQKKLTYILEKGKKTKSHQELAIAKTEGKLIVKAGTKNLLNYQYETLYPPKGVDTIFKRNAFIHPLLSPHGQELTRIQPPDHYHHYGIWNPWTRVLFEGDTVDFWNLYDKKGTVRFANFTSQSSGQIFSEFEAVH
ncbi:MAG: PmoA family protein, partial [Thermoflexibacter sp.]|nr:PmoA family protein [Thermoflexibacter sp.]